MVTAADPAAKPSTELPLADATPAAVPTVFTTSVLIARIALVAISCLLIAVLPYLFTTEEKEIVSYPAPKETPRQLPAAAQAVEGTPGRLWGAVLPQENELWFFKLTGPTDSVQGLETALKEFLQTVRFQAGEPTWTLPAEWTQQPGNQFRFATIIVPAEPPLELTVSKLPRGDGPLDEQLLANINRWRGQVSQPPVKLEELGASTELVDVDGTEATVIALTGTIKPNNMGRPPFMGKN